MRVFLSQVKRNQRNSKGLSLVEVLILMGVLAVATVGGMSIVNQYINNHQTQKFRNNAKQLTKDIKMQLSDHNACFHTFGGIDTSTLSALVVPSIKDTIDGDAYAPGMHKDNSVNVTQIVANNYIDISATEGQMNLEIHLESPIHPTGAGQLVKVIPINITKLGTQIGSCYSGDTSTTQVWSTVSPTVVTTNYNVGIGTSQPQAALEVEGLIHGRPDCTVRQGPVRIAESHAMCEADEWAIGGGGFCSMVDFIERGAYSIQSEPFADFSGWTFDCFPGDPFAGYGGPIEDYDIAYSNGYAICCKK